MSETNESPLWQPFGSTSAVLLFEDSWRVILQGWRTFLPLLLMLIGLLLGQGALDSSLVGIGGPLGAWLTVAAYLFVSGFAWLTGAAAVVIADAVSDRRSASLSGAYAVAGRRFWPYLVTLTLLSAIVMEGGLLFVVPGLLLQLALFPAVYAVLLEGRRPREALARSRFLTTGNKGSLLARLFVFWFFCSLLVLIPLRVIVGRVDWRWLTLPPMNAFVWMAGSDAPEPAWLPYVAAVGGALWTLLFGTFMVLVFKGLRSDRGDGLTPVPAWPAFVFVAIGAPLAALALPSYIATKAFVARAVPATGVLVGPMDTADSAAGVTMSYPVAVEFTAPDGIKRRFGSVFTQAGLTDRPAGSPVAILFDPEDPSDGRIDGLPCIWGAFVLKLVAGLGLLAIGLAQWTYLRRPIAAPAPSGDGRLPPSPGREG